ncbi:PAS domain S-box protein [Paraflavisolibacter sp. H34]|uniref:PAS domain-containing sensor histidine kinase n=1 Tax=Huijunlia imazamoxiresistens TaxID=3127457 RepID=UPI0030167050
MIRENNQPTYEKLLDLSPDVLCSVNEEGIFVTVSAAARELWGYEPRELVGTSYFRLLPEPQHPKALSLEQRLRNGSPQLKISLDFLHKSGSLVPATWSAQWEAQTGLMYCVARAAGDATEKMALQKMLVEEKVTAQKEISKAIISTQEKERGEIGKELHDNINQLLTTAKLCMENTFLFPDQRDLFARKSVDLVQTAIREIQALSRRWVGPSLQELSLKAALTELVGQYRALNRFRVEEFYSFCESALDKELKINLYRMVQEQLNNTLKYARASRVQLSLVGDARRLRLVIEDDGVGFDPPASPKGLGLANIRNRAALFRGKAVISSSAGKGCRLEVVFPQPGVASLSLPA